MMNDLKAFVMRGNMVDMVVGIVIGVAFGAIIISTVNDVIMPPIGLLLCSVDFSNLMVVLKEGTTPAPYPSVAEAQAAGAVTINYGQFINTIISFLIIALVVSFFVVRPIARMEARRRVEEPAAEPTTRECPFCFTVIPVRTSRCPNCTSTLA
ncbi:MAG: large conductance mechanosensitive channel protein MscL [Chloroflexota bacterium]